MAWTAIDLATDAQVRGRLLERSESERESFQRSHHGVSLVVVWLKKST
jgi:hypothetical protein